MRSSSIQGNKTITVVVADPRPAGRLALRRMVERGWGWPVVAEVADGIAAVRAVREADADVLLVDATADGLTLASELMTVGRALVVGLADSPSQLLGARCMTALKGIPARSLRARIADAVRARQGRTEMLATNR